MERGTLSQGSLKMSRETTRGNHGRIEERLNVVMVDGHAVSVGRNRADKLNRILFTIPTTPPL